jgi:hypothetical protein
MRFHLSLITAISLIYLAAGLYISFSGNDGYIDKRFVFTALGILGWLIGNKLGELDERLTEFEKRSAPPA